MKKDEILKIMQELAVNVLKQEDSESFSYIQQRNMILRIFRQLGNYDIPTIMLRLTVIDSLYSTNAQYSYFSIEDMAKRIFALGKNEAAAIDYFKRIAQGEKDTNGIFSTNYGIRKNLDNGSKQLSLMSKYAYYALMLDNDDFIGFPIYDSLALETYPKLYKILFGKEKNHKQTAIDSIEQYVAALEELRKELFGYSKDRIGGMQHFDALDAYLWRIGKLSNGNYSLLLTKDEYEKFISNLSLQNATNESLWEKFNTVLHKYVKRTTYRKKNGQGTVKYNVNFNAIVKYQCQTMDTEAITKELNSSIISLLIDHWKKYYV